MFGSIERRTWSCFQVLWYAFAPGFARTLPFLQRRFGIIRHFSLEHRIRQLHVVAGSVDEALLGSFSIVIAGNRMGCPDSLHQFVTVVNLIFGIFLLVLR